MPCYCQHISTYSTTSSAIQPSAAMPTRYLIPKTPFILHSGLGCNSICLPCCPRSQIIASALFEVLGGHQTPSSLGYSDYIAVSRCRKKGPLASIHSMYNSQEGFCALCFVWRPPHLVSSILVKALHNSYRPLFEIQEQPDLRLQYQSRENLEERVLFHCLFTADFLGLHQCWHGCNLRRHRTKDNYLSQVIDEVLGFLKQSLHFFILRSVQNKATDMR